MRLIIGVVVGHSGTFSLEGDGAGGTAYRADKQNDLTSIPPG